MLTCSRCGLSYSAQVEFCGLDGERLATSPGDPLIGRALGNYLVQSLIGDGGMGRVYKARHRLLGTDAAVKVLFGELASDRVLAERFRREARAASTIRHENVVSVLDSGKSDAGVLYMIMELVDGPTLAEVLSTERKLEPARAAGVLRQMAEGLAAAHDLGFVHRDLKSRNVMLVSTSSRGEVVKILDFGLVAIVGAAAGDATELTKISSTGNAFGTPPYMAPEQITGAAVTSRTDLYALGVMLYEMLTGQRPFRGSAAHVIAQHVSTPPPPLPPAGGLERLALQMLEKDPERRPESARAVIAELDRLGVSPAEAWASATPLRVSITPRRIAKQARDTEGRDGRDVRGADAHDTAPGPTPEPPRARKTLAFFAAGAVVLGLGVGAFALSRDAVEAEVGVVAPTPPAPAPAPAPAAPAPAPLAATPPAPAPTGAQAPASAPAAPEPAAAPAASPDTAARAAPAPKPSPRPPRSERAEKRTPPAQPPPVQPAERAPAETTQVPLAQGYLTLSTTPWADAVIDGRPSGPTPLFKIPLAPGRHEVRLRREALGIDVSRTVEVRPGENLKLEIDLKAAR